MPIYPDDRLANPHRIGLTAGERARHFPGMGIVTNGVGERMTAHLNLDKSLADLFDIRMQQNGTTPAGPSFHWVWVRKEPPADG